jgi:hypothetical protein
MPRNSITQSRLLEPGDFVMRVFRRCCKHCALLGLPPDVRCVHIEQKGESQHKAWAGYKIRMWGMFFSDVDAVIQSAPHYLTGRVKTIHPPDGEAISILLWKQTATYSGSQVKAAVHWRPDIGRHEAILGLEHTDNKHDLDKAWNGLRLLRLVPPVGRPSEMTFSDPTALHARILDICITLIRTNPQADPTAEEIAAILNVDTGTLFRNLKSHQMRFSALKREARALADES